MATRIMLAMSGTENAGTAAHYDVTETFETCLERVTPTDGGPSSALAYRALCIYTKEDGGAIYISPPAIVTIEEVV